MNSRDGKMNLRKPKLSIIIPAYNEEEHIGRLLKQLNNQTYKNFEIIVVDDKSKDKTREIAKQLGARVLVSGRHNLPFSKNLGMKNATGEVMLNIEADSEIHDNKFLENVAKCFQDPKVKGIKVRQELIQDSLLERLDYLRTAYKHPYSEAVQIFRRGIYFDEGLVCMGEWNAISKRIKGKIVCCENALMKYHRFHSLNELIKSWKKYPTIFYYYRKYEKYAILKTLYPLFFPFINPFYMIRGLIKFKDIRALLLPLYDIARSLAYLIGIFSLRKMKIRNGGWIWSE